MLRPSPLRPRSRVGARGWPALLVSWAAGFVAIFVVGCGQDARGVWLDLTDPEAVAASAPSGTRGSSREVRAAESVSGSSDQRRVEVPALGRRAAALVSSLEGASLELTIPLGLWEKHEIRGVWEAPLGLQLVGHTRADNTAYRLWTSETTYQPSQLLANDVVGKRFGPGMFHVEEDRVLLRIQPGQGLAPKTHFSITVRGAEPEVRGRRFSGRALSVWSGDRVERHLNVPRASVLRFATTSEPVALDPGEGTVRYRVWLDDELLFEHAHPDAREPYAAWHEVDLPANGRDRATLAFEVDGPLASSSFFAPRIGPAEIGRYGERPWKNPRPDIVLFIADTFRADNLSVYGGTWDVAPNLDALVEQSVCFRRAWSVGTYTLPSHASLFTGVFPVQAGITSASCAVPDELQTIAETLQAQGYRTGAITDSAIVSQRFGMAQGFEWFDEAQISLASTTQRAMDFLAADDGRPTFLVVQSYRVHRPYRVSPETRSQHGERLGIETEFEELERRLLELASERGTHGLDGAWVLPEDIAGSEAAAGIVRELESHYRGGVLDFDRGFARFHEELERTGLLDSGYLIFTSDHGEAFAEHGAIYHGEDVFEEKIRIPLFVLGDKLEPRMVDHAASLVDLPPTIAAMAHVAPDERWLGQALLELTSDRPIFSFECGAPVDATYSVIEGPHKIIGPANEAGLREAAVLGAFDLSVDPREANNLRDAGLDWPIDLARRYGPVTRTLLEPLVGQEAVQLDAQAEAELRALGYGGSE